MVQRHVHDDVERLWPGAADPRHPRFVPIPLRDVVADCPADIEQKMRRELYTVPETSRIIDRNRSVTVNPASDPDDLETALVWRKNEWAARQLAGQRFDADLAASDRRNYSCQVCARVVTPDGVNGHTRYRRFADGTTATVCGACAKIIERLTVDRLATELVDGVSRADRARRLLEQATP